MASDETAQLVELLKACDEALVTCQASVVTKEAVIIEQRVLMETQAERIGELESQQSGILNNKLVWFFMGLAAGGITISLIK